MKKLEAKTWIQKYWPLCLSTLFITVVMRYFCRISDSDALTWILAPTARWAGILGGIPFEYLPHQGYVNHFYRFLIAPSCSGIRFMMITFLMLAFSFLFRIESPRAGYLWFTFSTCFSYLAAVFVNGIRIVLAIYLPLPLEEAGLLNGWLNPDRLHTLIGTVVYFSSLCVIYPAASFICRHGFMQSPEGNGTALTGFGHSMRFLIPMFWYLSVVLAFPFLKRILQNDWDGFLPYAMLIIGVCTAIAIPAALINRWVSSR